MMKQYAFEIARKYRKNFAHLATKKPDMALRYWYDYNNQLSGVLSMLAYDNSISVNEHAIICKYLCQKMRDLYEVYCK